LAGAPAVLRRRRAGTPLVEFSRWLRYHTLSARDVAMTE
jgi:hypothetical protein